MLKLCILFALLVTFVSSFDNKEDEEKEFSLGRRFNPGCTSCKMGMVVLTGFLDSGLKEALLPALQAECAKIADDKPEVQDLCMQFAGENGEVLVDMILDILEPDRFCELVNAC